MTNEQKAAELMAIVVGSYPRQEAAIPEIYTKRLEDLFLQYPRQVSEKVAEAVTLEYRTLPAIANVARKLNEELAYVERHERAQRTRMLRGEREKEDEPRTPPAPEQKAAVAKICEDIRNRLRMPGIAPSDTR